jgi:hypothetical protein
MLLSHAGKQEGAMRLEFGMAPAAARLRREPPARTISLHQIDGKGDRDLKMRGSTMPRVAGFDKAHNAFTQIKGVGLRHSDSPP